MEFKELLKKSEKLSNTLAKRKEEYEQSIIEFQNELKKTDSEINETLMAYLIEEKCVCVGDGWDRRLVSFKFVDDETILINYKLVSISNFTREPINTNGFGWGDRDDDYKVKISDILDFMKKDISLNELLNKNGGNYRSKSPYLF